MWFWQDCNLVEEGLYRISGPHSRVIQLYEDTFIRGQECDLEAQGISTVASVIKKYLRELPDALMQTEMFTLWLGAVVTQGSCHDRLLDCFKKLPPVNQRLLSLLLTHLKRVRPLDQPASRVFSALLFGTRRGSVKGCIALKGYVCCGVY